MSLSWWTVPLPRRKRRREGHQGPLWVSRRGARTMNEQWRDACKASLNCEYFTCVLKRGPSEEARGLFTRADKFSAFHTFSIEFNRENPFSRFFSISSGRPQEDQWNSVLLGPPPWKSLGFLAIGAQFHQFLTFLTFSPIQPQIDQCFSAKFGRHRAVAQGFLGMGPKLAVFSIFKVGRPQHVLRRANTC